ncbi:MAG TPA: zinc ribbon domain-containing protein [Actinomycetota bacterium]|nr:zinc ribbon domain-containing protein [Actinomycetota bacterium]
MLVCPNCRSDNLEDAKFCRFCGRSLEPVGLPPRRLEARDQTDHMDIPPPRTPSALPGIIALVLVGVGLTGGGLWYAMRPNPCEGKFSSALFAYCTEIPAGWSGGSQLAGQESLDQFTPGGEDAVTWVRVQEILDPAIQTPQYAQQFRTSQEANGLAPGQIEQLNIDGEEALAWEVSVAGEGGQNLVLREVVLVREDGAWRIELVATQDMYPQARVAFENLLASWRWK